MTTVPIDDRYEVTILPDGPGRAAGYIFRRGGAQVEKVTGRGRDRNAALLKALEAAQAWVWTQPKELPSR